MVSQRAGRIMGFVRLMRFHDTEANEMAKFTQMAPAKAGSTDRSGSGGKRRRRRRRRNRRRRSNS
jgi:hypothetical protein